MKNLFLLAAAAVLFLSANPGCAIAPNTQDGRSWKVAGQAGSTEDEIKSFIQNQVLSNKVFIFSKSYCPYCKRAKSTFAEIGVKPSVIELDQHEQGSRIQDVLSDMVGRRTVPQVFVNGKHIGGSDDTVALYESGELAKLVGADVNNGHEF